MCHKHDLSTCPLKFCGNTFTNVSSKPFILYSKYDFLNHIKMKYDCKIIKNKLV